MAIDNRRLVRAGGGPLAEKRAKQRQATIPTFREAAQRTREANLQRWRNDKHTVSWMQTLERHAMLRLGDMPVDQIGREDVLAVLVPIWSSLPETAHRIRQRIRVILRWCQAHGYIGNNPASEGIDGALPSMPKVKAHHRVLPYNEIAAALHTVAATGASMAAKLCFRFVALTAARSREARAAKWDEIDMNARTWTIPGERMKGGIEHRVPLSDATVAVLEQARMLDDESGLGFPSPTKRGQPLPDMTLTKVLRDTKLAERTTVHGFRSSFRDWCAETGKPREVAEAALVHIGGRVEGAYFRSDLFERRRRLMDQWAAYLTGESAKVVSIGKGR